MNTNTATETRIVTYYTSDGVLRRTRVNITEGYSDETSIPKILAVKHYSSNDAEAVAQIRVMLIAREEK